MSVLRLVMLCLLVTIAYANEPDHAVLINKSSTPGGFYKTISYKICSHPISRDVPQGEPCSAVHRMDIKDPLGGTLQHVLVKIPLKNPGTFVDVLEAIEKDRHGNQIVKSLYLASQYHERKYCTGFSHNVIELSNTKINHVATVVCQDTIRRAL